MTISFYSPVATIYKRFYRFFGMRKQIAHIVIINGKMHSDTQEKNDQIRTCRITRSAATTQANEKLMSALINRLSRRKRSQYE